MINTERFVQLENGGDRHNSSKCLERVQNLNLLASNSLHYLNFIKEVGTILESYSGPWSSVGSKLWYLQDCCVPWFWLCWNVMAQKPWWLGTLQELHWLYYYFCWFSCFFLSKAETIDIYHFLELFSIIDITQALGNQLAFQSGFHWWKFMFTE